MRSFTALRPFYVLRAGMRSPLRGGGGGAPVEPTETFTYTISSLSSNATIGTATGTVTITQAFNNDLLFWSEPSTWGGSVPTSSDDVVIAAGRTIILNVPDAVAKSVSISGSLVASRDISVGLTAGHIMVTSTGTLEVGTEASPYPSAYKATITLNGAEASRTARVVNSNSLGFTNNGMARSIHVHMGGTLSLIGSPPLVKRTKLNAHAEASATSFTLAEATGWKAGDEIAVGTTDFYGVASAERLTLSTNAAGTGVVTTTGITAPRWGVLQHITDAGVSLTAGTLTNPPVGTETVLDERAFVINLTRNIVVQGANDEAWTTNKFGAHTMFMGRTSNVKIDGVQFRRVGQAGAIGRYPLHWHMMSYNMPNGMNQPSDGTFLGLALNNQYAKNCAIEQSSQRMAVIHGTHGVTLDSNVGFDITGHAIFLEDGSEQDNVITNNVVMKIRAPTSGNKLYLHDTPANASVFGSPGVTGINGTCGIWFANPKNTLTGNWVNDSEGNGVWNTFAPLTFGLSKNVVMDPTPQFTPMTNWDGNWAFGCKSIGVKTNDNMLTDEGTLTQSGYKADFKATPIKRAHSFKNSGGGYSNRIDNGRYEGFVLADNAGMDIFGQSQFAGSLAVNVLSVAESLNNATSKRLSSCRAAFATYHELLNFQDGIFVDYKYIEGVQLQSDGYFLGGGVFRTWDLYTKPIFNFSLNTGNKLIGCEAPFRTRPPNIDGAPLARRHGTLAGAIHDVNGVLLGADNAGKFWVFDDAFFTYGAAGLANATSGVPSNGKITSTRFYGVASMLHADDLEPYPFNIPISVKRLNTSGGVEGEWNVADGATGTNHFDARFFAPQKGGRYRMDIPNSDADIAGAGLYGGTAHPASACDYFEFKTSYQLEAGDNFVFGVPFGGAMTPIVYQRRDGLSARDGAGKATIPGSLGATDRLLNSTGMTSIADVEADTTGLKFWQDVANNIVWVSVRTNALTPGALESEYKPVSTVIRT